MTTPAPPQRPDPPAYHYMKYGAVAFEFVGMIAAGVFLGYELDAWAGTAPWLIMSFTILGTVGGFYRMIQILRQFERQK